MSLCALAMIVEGFDTYAIGYVGPAISAEWKLSQSFVGLLYATGVVASLFGSVALGTAADWIGRKTLLILSCLLFGGATLLGAAAPSVEWLLLSRAVAGIGLGASIPCAMALAVESVAEHRRAAVPIFLSAMIGAGNLIAGLCAAAIMPLGGWRGLLVLGGALPVLIACAMPFLLRETLARPVATDKPLSSVSGLFAPAFLPRLITAMLALVAIYMVTFFMGFWLPTLLHEITPDIREVGIAVAIVKTCSLAGSLLIGLLVSRYGIGRVLPPAALMAALAVALFAGSSTSLTGAIIGFSIASFFLDATFSGAISLSTVLFPDRHRASAIGLTIGVARLVGGTAGPMLGGFLLDRHFGLSAISLTFAVPLVVASLLASTALRMARRQDR